MVDIIFVIWFPFTRCFLLITFEKYVIFLIFVKFSEFWFCSFFLFRSYWYRTISILNFIQFLVHHFSLFKISFEVLSNWIKISIPHLDQQMICHPFKIPQQASMFQGSFRDTTLVWFSITVHYKPLTSEVTSLELTRLQCNWHDVIASCVHHHHHHRCCCYCSYSTTINIRLILQNVFNCPKSNPKIAVVSWLYMTFF